MFPRGTNINITTIIVTSQNLKLFVTFMVIPLYTKQNITNPYCTLGTISWFGCEPILVAKNGCMNTKLAR